MRLPSHDRPTPPLPAALDRCPRLVGREFSGTRGRSAASFRQAAIPLHQNGGRHLRPHRPQRSRHCFSRSWRGRSERCHCRYRPHRGLPSARAEPRSRWPDWISAGARTVRTVRTVAPPAFLARPSVGWYGSGLRAGMLPRCRPCAGRLPPGAAGPRGHAARPLVPRPKRQFTSDCPSKSVPVNDLGQMANEVIE